MLRNYLGFHSSAKSIPHSDSDGSASSEDCTCLTCHSSFFHKYSSNVPAGGRSEQAGYFQCGECNKTIRSRDRRCECNKDHLSEEQKRSFSYDNYCIICGNKLWVNPRPASVSQPGGSSTDVPTQPSGPPSTTGVEISPTVAWPRHPEAGWAPLEGQVGYEAHQANEQRRLARSSCGTPKSTFPAGQTTKNSTAKRRR